MYLFDLHCDTVSTCLVKQKSLLKNDLHLDIERGCAYEKWVQTFAFWLNDSYHGERAYQYFLEQYSFFQRTMKKDSRLQYYGDNQRNTCQVLLSVEGGHALGGKLSRAEEMQKMGISFFTLVWNGENELGSGVLGTGGLTPFGKEVVTELERCHIVVDISHLNEAGFNDICEIAKRPIAATHSNARKVCDNPRNLWDNQLLYLINSNGLCGINLYPLFVNGEKDCSYEDILRHIEHILALGGADILAIGTDFDGAAMPSRLNGVERLYSLYEFMLKYYNREIVDKIFYYNASRFVKTQGLAMNRQ